jgi:aryl-alcohol dehydrogenase-like predicted oxidoreductase
MMFGSWQPSPQENFMRYSRLGRSGLTVSRLALGCMSYGDPTRGAHAWTLDEKDSRQHFARALDLGITFFDTANVYSDGSSEEITGRALLSRVRRDEVVIATKVGEPMGSSPNAAGLSRGSIMTQVDQSLRRLGTDYIDLYVVHRADPLTPWEETMQALHDLVRAGKVRYIGASSMGTWQFARAMSAAAANALTTFVSMQNHYNLLYREEERDMIPWCLENGVGLTPWSPLARGRLARDPGETTGRSSIDQTARSRYQDDSALDIIDAVGSVAEGRGLTRAQVAMAWLLHQPGVIAPVIGATKTDHLFDAAAALEVQLSVEETSLMEAAYRPQVVQGHAARTPLARPSS